MRPDADCVYSGHERLNEIGIDFFGGPNSVYFDKKHFNAKVGFGSNNARHGETSNQRLPIRVPVLFETTSR